MKMNRVTLTPRLFNAARETLFLVAGEGKARAVADTLNPNAPTDVERLPARAITPEAGPPLWLLDKAAAGLL